MPSRSNEKPSESSSGNVATARRLRQQLSRAQGRVRQLETSLEEEQAHSSALENMLDDAYERLRAAGLTDPIDFPVSLEARRLYAALDLPADLDELLAAGKQLGCQKEETNALVDELTEEGVIKRATGQDGSDIETPGLFRDTGHRPFF